MHADTGRVPSCDLPPEGWWCSKTKGHDGPCPTRRVNRADEVRDDEALLLFPTLWKAHEYLRREDAPDHNKVAVVLRMLDDALLRWEDANPLPDDEEQTDA